MQRTDVTKFQVIGNEIVALIDIMTDRQGLVELITPGDLTVDHSLANDFAVTRTKVNTEIQLALDNVREQLDRFEFDKAKHQAGIKDRARLAIEGERAPRDAAAADPAAIPRTQHVNRITRFQPTDTTRKPKIMDIDDNFGKFFENIPKMEAYYRDAAVPEGFTPESQQQQFMGFVSPTLGVQLKQRLEKIPNATWTDCLEEVKKIMEIRHPEVWRRLEAFTIEPNELEQTEYSRFLARQKELWTQANVDKMSIGEMKMIHIVKLIPDRKLKAECAEILTQEKESLDEIEKKVATFESPKNLAARMSGTKEQIQDRVNATINATMP